MEEMVRRANYAGQKFLLNNYKLDIKNVFRYDGVLRSYDVSAPIFDKVKKYYYDTPDLFFRNNGINISVNHYSSKSYLDIIVRYDSNVERIAFVGNMPDTFIKKLRKGDRLSNHYNYMATAILELVPKGLNADVFEVIKDLQPILLVTKKRERYRVIHNNGLKMVFGFEKSEFTSLTKRQKIKLNTLELRLESGERTKPDFINLIRQLHLQEAMFIKLRHSDLFIGFDYLDI